MAMTGRTVGGVAATLAALSTAGVTWGVVSVNRSDALVGVGLLVAPLLVPWLVAAGRPSCQRAGVPVTRR